MTQPISVERHQAVKRLLLAWKASDVGSKCSPKTLASLVREIPPLGDELDRAASPFEWTPRDMPNVADRLDDLLEPHLGILYGSLMMVHIGGRYFLQETGWRTMFSRDREAFIQSWWESYGQDQVNASQLADLIVEQKLFNRAFEAYTPNGARKRVGEILGGRYGLLSTRYAIEKNRGRLRTYHLEPKEEAQTPNHEQGLFQDTFSDEGIENLISARPVLEPEEDILLEVLLGQELPYGVRGIQVLPHEQEQDLLTRIRQMQASGLDNGQIAQVLTLYKETYRGGVPWTPGLIGQVLDQQVSENWFVSSAES